MTLALQTQKLVDAAHGHSTLIQAMGKNKLAQRFAEEKKALKNLVHEAIDNGYSKNAVMKQMPKLPNPTDATKDRFAAKVNRYFKKHKAEAPKVKTADLFPKMAQAANTLKDTYVKEIDAGANIAAEEKPAVYKDYRKAKGAYKEAAKPLLKGKTEVELLALQQILNKQELCQKTVEKLKTFHTKFNRVKQPEANNACSKMAYAVVAAVAVVAVGVLVRVAV